LRKKGTRFVGPGDFTAKFLRTDRTEYYFDGERVHSGKRGGGGPLGKEDA